MSKPVFKSNTFETYIKVPKKIGTGKVKKIKLHNGIILNIQDSQFTEIAVNKIEEQDTSCGIGFCLSGQMNVKLNFFKKKFIITKGQSTFFYFSDRNGIYEPCPHEALQRIFIEIKPQNFFSFLNEEPDLMPKDLLRAVERDQSVFYRSVDTITPGMQMLLRQILNCPYHGIARRFFFEGKVMELIACKLAQLETSKQKAVKTHSPKPVDIERVYQAKTLLVKHLQNPPSMTTLAKKLGTSRTKLYYDFCKIHGEPPTNFLRDQRIEKAGLLLQEGNMNVTEVAYSVGYSNISYFAKVFREYFSMPPSVYRINRHGRSIVIATDHNEK